MAIGVTFSSDHQSGVLQPGYYLFKIEAKLDWNQPLPFGAAEADGFVDLQLSSFANQAAVPEPNSFRDLGPRRVGDGWPAAANEGSSLNGPGSKLRS